MKEEEDKFDQMERFLQAKDPEESVWELTQQSLGSDLGVEERETYCRMLKKYPNLFITSYEEIRGFKGDSLRIELKDGMKPVRQRLRRMGQEQMQAL